MKISQVIDNEIAVSDYRPLPGQMAGLAGIGQYSGDSDLLMGLGAFGQAAQGTGFLDAIKKSAASVTAAAAAQQKQKIAAAKSSPVAAAAIFSKARQTSAPGTNVQRGIISALKSAAKDATVAQQKRAVAKKLLAQGDKRGAAAASVQYLTAARAAAIKATKAEKTKVATNLDIMAKRLDEAGKKAASAAEIMVRKAGPTPQTDRLKAVANQMAENVKKLRAQAAAVQDTPDTPPGLPTPQRIADVANKFNIRTTMQNRGHDRKALISVLADSMDSALAQAPDYEAAVAYYGNDMMGKLAADIEYGNYNDVVMGLHGIESSLAGLGQFEFINKLSSAVGSVVAKGEQLVQKAADTYNKSVKPLVDKAASAVGLKKTPPPVTPPAAAPAAAPAPSTSMTPAAPAAPEAPAAGGMTGMMAGKMPLIIGGVAAAAVIGYFVMKK